MIVTLGLHYNVILAMPWLKKQHPKIEWNSKSVIFNSNTCCNHCLRSNKGFPITVLFYEHPQKMPTPVLASKLSWPTCNTPIPISAIAFQHLASKPDYKLYSVSLRDIEQALKPKVKTDPTIVLPEPHKEILKFSAMKRQINCHHIV